MGRTRGDIQSEGLERLPRPVRWLVRVIIRAQVVFRAYLVLMVVVGLVNVVVGVATLRIGNVAGGLFGLLFGSFLLAMHGGSESLTEVKGPAGAFVIRSRFQRRWRQVRGVRKLTALVRGERAWVVTVRRREDDPFGAAVRSDDLPTERAARERADELAKRIRAGEDLSASSPSSDAPYAVTDEGDGSKPDARA